MGRRKTNFGPPWKTRGKLKVGVVAVSIWAWSSNANGRESKFGWVICILGRRRATPRWGNDLVWQSETMGRRQGTPRCADEPMLWLWRGLGKQEGIWNMHNNKRQILGFEQSMTEARKNYLIFWSHCFPLETI